MYPEKHLKVASFTAHLPILQLLAITRNGSSKHTLKPETLVGEMPQVWQTRLSPQHADIVARSVWDTFRTLAIPLI